jgi:VIT1/CCC1 family predicted Fe2+/Mn2+ transporter
MNSHEEHRTHRAGWLRAAVLGANDGIVSTSSLLMGVVASGMDLQGVLIAGVAGLVAGSMSMAAGEYVSVSSQADIERSDLEREREELETDPEFEKKELAQIYVKRGLDQSLAHEVAVQLMDHDAIGAHARDELGIFEIVKARPVQAALTSAGAFAVGASLPLGIVFFVPRSFLIEALPLGSLLFLGLLGSVSAWVGGASKWRAAFRVMFWSSLAMGLTALIGSLFNVSV